jgi:hypothetical protein
MQPIWLPFFVTLFFLPFVPQPWVETSVKYLENRFQVPGAGFQDGFSISRHLTPVT